MHEPEEGDEEGMSEQEEEEEEEEEEDEEEEEEEEDVIIMPLTWAKTNWIRILVRSCARLARKFETIIFKSIARNAKFFAAVGAAKFIKSAFQTTKNEKWYMTRFFWNLNALPKGSHSFSAIPAIFSTFFSQKRTFNIEQPGGRHQKIGPPQGAKSESNQNLYAMLHHMIYHTNNNQRQVS